MKKEHRSYKLFLEDMQTAMIRISEYIDGLTFSDFEKDHKTVDAVIRNLEIIGEASNKLPEDIKEKYSDVPWKEMYLLRNKISHGYFGIDCEIIWDVALNYLPVNKIQIDKILRDE
jgi:hypothetical protein